MRYAPKDGLHVCIMSQGYADEHTRRTHNVPDDVGLGWTPYRIVVTGFGGIPHTAFHTMRDFRAWLGESHWLTLGGWSASGMRAGTIVGNR